MYTEYVYPIRLGLAFSIIMFIGVLCVSILTKFGYGGHVFRLLEDSYPGCNSKNAWGVFMCALLGAVDGFIGGALIGFLYNVIDIRV